MAENEKPAPPPRRRRRLWRILRLGFAGCCLVWLLPAMTGCMNLSTPVDYVMNLGSMKTEAALQAPEDGRRHLVVLRHGLWRSAASFGRLERALRAHGYEVLNESYASTDGFIEDHARALGAEIRARLQAMGPGPVELYLVGHSMGGLQIRHLLAQEDAPVVRACVFVGTPHRGAVLLDKRRNWLIFSWIMGDEAPLQLSPGHAFYRGLRRIAVPSGVIYGGRGDGVGWNDDIPGDDDGTVGIDEAQLPEATDRIRMPLGHTALSMHEDSLRQVLFFLKHRRFDR